MTVKRTERGWAGHFICAHQCRFRRNTLLTCGDTRVVVSTVGLQENLLKGKGFGFDDPFSEVGAGRHFETMVFYADSEDARYYGADVTQQVPFDSPWFISEVDADDRANDMHEVVVAEILNKLIAGEIK